MPGIPLNRSPSTGDVSDNRIGRNPCSMFTITYETNLSHDPAHPDWRELPHPVAVQAVTEDGARQRFETLVRTTFGDDYQYRITRIAVSH